jgi:hypothetical protein
MPRKDGFSTNEELLLDLTSSTRELFLESLRISTAGDIAHPYVGKPLSNVSMVISHDYQDPEYLVANRIRREQLCIRTLRESNVNALLSTFRLRGAPEYVREHYMSVANYASRLCVSNSADFGSTLPNEAFTFSYAAFFNSTDRTRHVDLFKFRPAKQSIIAATYFAANALQQLAQPEPMDSVVDEYHENPEHAFGGRGYETIVYLDCTPDLPLNGSEHPKFLHFYHREMLRLAASYRRWIRTEQSKPTERTAWLVSEYTKTREEYIAAANRALIIIKANNDQ